METGSSAVRIGTAGCIVLPAASFIGLMVATAGMAIYPPVTAVANPLICAGEVVYESQSYSYRPGQSGVQRTIYCQSGSGKGSREDVTFKAIGVSFLVYSAAFFLLLNFLVRPLLRRRYRSLLDAAKARRGQGGGPSARAPGGMVDLGDILARVSDAMEQGGANPAMPPDGDGGRDDLAARLGQLRDLRDRGLITDADYASKKAELLSRL